MVLEAVRAACARTALCSPAVHLNGVSRSSAASIQRGQRVRGREQVGLQPAGAELQPEPGLGDRVGGRQPVARRATCGSST